MWTLLERVDGVKSKMWIEGQILRDLVSLKTVSPALRIQRQPDPRHVETLFTFFFDPWPAMWMTWEENSTYTIALGRRDLPSAGVVPAGQPQPHVSIHLLNPASMELSDPGHQMGWDLTSIKGGVLVGRWVLVVASADKSGNDPGCFLSGRTLRPETKRHGPWIGSTHRNTGWYDINKGPRWERKSAVQDFQPDSFCDFGKRAQVFPTLV